MVHFRALPENEPPLLLPRERSERLTKYLRSGHNLKTSFFD
ncbi:MAG: hypothetical protein U5L45_01500 [Saprospiraceae bacterium]|nr:hypothetical protein [Saprospiraceae bacterium]